jgi:hypothetical protein
VSGLFNLISVAVVDFLLSAVPIFVALIAIFRVFFALGCYAF